MEDFSTKAHDFLLVLQSSVRQPRPPLVYPSCSELFSYQSCRWHLCVPTVNCHCRSAASNMTVTLLFPRLAT